LGLSNILEGSLAEDVPGLTTLTTLSGLRLTCPALEATTGKGMLMIRPEKVVLATHELNGENCFSGVIVGLKYLGATIEYHIKLQSGERIVAQQQQRAGNTVAYRAGGPVTVQLPTEALHWLDETP